MKKITMFFMSLVIGLGVFVAVPQLASAATAKSTVCDGIGASSGADGCTDGSGKSINDILAMLINMMSTFSCIFMVVSLFKEEKRHGALFTALLYTVIAISSVIVCKILIEIGWVLVRYVVGRRK